MGKTVNFSQTNLIPLMRALKENVELDTYTIGGEPDAPVGGRYYHVSDKEVNEEETLVTESKNSSRAHKQTRQLIAKYIGGVDENDALVITAEQEFEQTMFGEGKRTDWMIVLEPVAYSWYIETKSMDTVKKYLNYIYLKGTETTPPSAYIATIKKLGNFNEVKQFVDQQIKTDDDASREEQANMAVNLNQNYEVCGPLSFDEAHGIGNYSNPNGKICYTQGEDVWESEEYGNYGVNKCYALLRNDWKSVPAEHDGSEANNGFPAPLNQFNGYDSYGLSMIFVWVGRFGNLSVSNTRWNHGADYAPGHGVDLALKELDIARLMGAPFEKIFGVNKVDIDAFVRENLANSKVSLSEIFDDIYEERDGITSVRIGQKYNYVVSYNDESNRYLLWDKPYDEWFDSGDDFMYNSGMAIVYLGDKTYFIDRYGKLHDIIQYINSKLLNGSRPENLFGEVDDSKSGVILRVTFDWRKFNFINSNTNQLLWNKPYEEWFDWCKPFDVGIKYNLVRKGQNLYYLDTDGNLHDFLECLQERIKHENLVYVFDNVDNYDSNDMVRVRLHGRYNYVNLRTSELIWKKPLKEWFLYASLFSRLGKAQVKLNGKICFLTASGELYDRNGNLISENIIYENYESEVESSEVDLSSFKKKDKLVPSIWKDDDTLDSKVRLKLLDIADDFWEFVNLKWVEPKGIILTGSICNFNWSEFSDIDLHLIVDFDDIDDRTDFVRDYMDAKKNEWNNEHKDLKIMGYPVELYVQNIDEMPESGGIYDLEENAWLRKPNYEDIKSIGLDKFSIKEKAAMIMTIIDDMWYALKTTDDMYDIRQLDDDASDLWKKVKAMRKDSLAKNGESGPGNIVYKVMRRMGYLDKLFDLRSAIYDKLNSINEAIHKFKLLTLENLKENKVNEEVVADGNAEHNPFEKRWKAERQALKDFLVNCGKIMTSKENGKQYKVFYDQTISNLIGYNYCICVQWNPIEMKPESTIYIRALDKFTNRIFQAQYDDRGRDNMRGTYDDMGYSQRFENKRITKQMLTEANNKKRFKRQTLNVLSQGLGLDPADPQLQSLESDFRNVYFGHLQNQEIDRVIGYEPLFAKCAIDIGFPDNNYDDTEFTKYVNYLILNTKDKENYTEIINHYKSVITSFNDMRQIVGTEIKASRDADIEQQANMGTTINSNYKVIGPLSFEEAKEYGNHSGVGAGQSGRICYSQYEDTWLSSTYSNDNTNPCFVLLRNDWQQLPGTEHDGSEANNGLGELSQYNAYDDYGLSMIMLFINAFDGSLHECNIRWNHGTNKTQFGPGRNVDHALTEMDISKILGVPFNQAFNVKTFDEKKEEALQKLANGEKAVRVFDMVAHMPTFRLTMVKLAGRINFLRYLDSKEVMFPDYWFVGTEMLSNNEYLMCYLDKDNVLFLDGANRKLFGFDEYVEISRNRILGGESPSDIFTSVDKLGSVNAVMIGNPGRGHFHRWNIMAKNGDYLSAKWEDKIEVRGLFIGIGALIVKFGDRYNVIFKHTMLINKPCKYWSTSLPLTNYSERNTYITYYDANGNYNAYNPITGEYAVPDGTNPWPSKNDVELAIYKKWHE